jgi:hypothetical protein
MLGVVASLLHRNQGTHTEGKGSVQLTSFYLPVILDALDTANIICFFLQKTSYLIKEVNHTEPLFSVSIPRFVYTLYLGRDFLLKG